MTTRDDVLVDFRSSPRVAEVEAPSTQMTMQDLVDTLRKLEDQFTGGVSFEKLLNASGKEELGGGVKVGITVALQNLLLAFEGRTTPAQVGTVTGSPANPIDTRLTMQDSAASFITNGVQRGSLLINFTDESVAEVYRVNSEIEIETKLLVEGIGNTYDNADVYKIWNIVQCNATGGNLVALDEFGATLGSPILPTAFTQIVLTSSSSATLLETGVSGLTIDESAKLDAIDTSTQSMDTLLASVDSRLATVESTVSSIDATVTLIDGTVTSLRKLMQNRMETNPTTGIMTIYDDDDTTPILTANIYEDVLAAQLYRGRGMERRNRLT